MTVGAPGESVPAEDCLGACRRIRKRTGKRVFVEFHLAGGGIDGNAHLPIGICSVGGVGELRRELAHALAEALVVGEKVCRLVVFAHEILDAADRGLELVAVRCGAVGIGFDVGAAELIVHGADLAGGRAQILHIAVVLGVESAAGLSVG